MRTLHTTAPLARPVLARLATPHDTDALERLWLVFRHHMSTYTGELPRPDGRYRSDRLDRALADPTWNAWMLTAGQHPIGFALTRSLDEPTKVINSFFVVTPARRDGLGTAFARAIVTHSPGRWSVAYQDPNHAAAAFWPRIAAGFDPEHQLERRPVPGKPHLPPDVWVTFDVLPDGTTRAPETF